MYSSLRSALFTLGPETAHNVASLAARFSQKCTPFLLDSMYQYAHPSLHQEILGKTFANPVGLAAGFDKNARMIPFFQKAGCGFVEVGSVSARKSKGNPRPRAFRLPDDQALINRMGLNNVGARAVRPRLQRYSGQIAFPVGVNLAKTHDPKIEGEAAIEDFCISFRELAPHADYVALNISCPNTAEGKTFEDPNSLDDLLTAVMKERNEMQRRVPILVKFSPPHTDKFVLDSLFDELLLVSLGHGVNGFIATNTASDREGLLTPEDRIEQIGRGGLSGQPIRARANGLVKYLYRKTKGRVPIIGVGGISSAEQAYERIKSGASLIQVYTGLVYQGPGLIRSIKEGLIRLMEEEGHSSISKVVGIESD
ncbi:MAG: quinone-dependent dihydroorotate dehydrogenase [Bacteroidetes bacterium]|nr:quinone-dependent dihydroorotate dehydrogenase [Bacteroidota bacterium]MDA1332700.1 quinone-dependent dihydroorotate dehydrogenase [Bacteroidota bacterium]